MAIVSITSLHQQQKINNIFQFNFTMIFCWCELLLFTGQN